MKQAAKTVMKVAGRHGLTGGSSLAQASSLDGAASWSFPDSTWDPWVVVSAVSMRFR